MRNSIRKDLDEAADQIKDEFGQSVQVADQAVTQEQLQFHDNANMIINNENKMVMIILD
jgi:hypothetical protein